MFCSNCGQPLNENDKFCPECGTPVEQQTAPIRDELPLETILKENAAPQEDAPQAAETTPESPAVTAPAAQEGHEPEPAPKKSHKALWIVLTCIALIAVLLTVLLVWHPWKKDSSRTQESTPAPVAENLTPEPTQSPMDALRAAAAQNQSVHSMHIDFAENFVMAIGIPAANYSQSMEVSLVLGMDAQKDPTLLRAEGSMTMLGQSQDILMYAEEIDGAQWTYTSANGGKTWTRQKQEQDSNSILNNPAELTELWMENAKDFERTGEEVMNGCTATVYSGTLAGEYLADAVDMTGMNSAFGEEDALAAIDDLPIVIWIDDDSGRIVRMRIDMKDMMTSLLTKSMEDSLSQMGDVEVTVDIDTAEVVCDFSQFDAVPEIVIPDEARGRGTAPAPEGDGIVGTWGLCGGEDEDSKQYVNMMLGLGMDMVFVFNEDGTGTMTMTYAGKSEETPFTYTFEDGGLTIEEETVPCRIEDGKLYLDLDDAKLVFERR